MTAFWREAGLSYLQASNIAAAALRRAVKAEVRVQALKREDQMLKMAKWSNGKQGENKLLYTEPK
ncbi:mitochondrial F1F0-ATP synthase subunit epsilon/ATP15 [Zopfochytrium polystomum]|nr:mitochondrial F1F0-ATP synthase subunit epsilon/ATP15 [Zopfochytrium polystomum]